MKDSSRNQGLAICAGAVALGLVFGLGLLSGAWWSVAIPVALLLAFVLGLTFWVGYTLATAPRPPAAQAAPPPGEGRRDEGAE
jgi:CHASE2 domain-containing sensor protein